MSTRMKTEKQVTDALQRKPPVTAAQVEAATEKLRRKAAKDGLLDVAYTNMDTPYGDMLLATTSKGIVRIGFIGESDEDVLDELAFAVSPRILEAPARLDPLRRELDKYFNGRLRRFTVKLDWRLVHGFQTKVLRTTAKIPYGQTRSYGEVAENAGNPRAYRAAGTALGGNPLAPIVPCHRVIRAGGDVGFYGGGEEMKHSLLRMEGSIE